MSPGTTTASATCTRPSASGPARSSASDEPFETTYIDVDHGVIARHGQEWDAFNFEGSEAFKLREYVPVPLEDYLRVPIGDLIACEIASRIPGVVRDNLGEDHPSRD